MVVGLKSRSLDYVRGYKERLQSVVSGISDEAVAQVIGILHAAREGDRRIFICGNGGSAATSSHLATDLGKGASLGRERRFRVLSLTDNLPWITALANDTDYSRVFVEQLQNYAAPGDVLIVFSGSGNSPNVIRAVEWANEAGLVTVGFTGRPGGRLAQTARHPIFVESSHMGLIEDGHFVMAHILGYFFMEGEATGHS